MQRRLGRIVLGAFAILGLAVGVGILSVSRTDYLRFIDQTLRNEAATRGVRLTTRNFDIFPFGVRATEVEAFIVRRLLSLTAANVVVEIPSPTPQVHFRGSAYGGGFEGRFQRGWFSKEAGAEGSFTNLHLTQHPQLNALGVTAGILKGSLSELSLDLGAHAVLDSRFDLALTGFARATPLTIPPGFFGAPLGFTIPPIPPTDLTAAGRFGRNVVTIERLTLHTELGTVTAVGSVPLDGRGKIAVDALISLSPLGGERLGAFLPVISAGTVPANSAKIRAVIQGTPRKPEIRWSRAG